MLLLETHVSSMLTLLSGLFSFTKIFIKLPHCCFECLYVWCEGKKCLTCKGTQGTWVDRMNCVPATLYSFLSWQLPSPIPNCNFVIGPAYLEIIHAQLNSLCKTTGVQSHSVVGISLDDSLYLHMSNLVARLIPHHALLSDLQSETPLVSMCHQHCYCVHRRTAMLQAADSLQSGKASYIRSKAPGAAAGAHLQTPKGIPLTSLLFICSHRCIPKEKSW